MLAANADAASTPEARLRRAPAANADAASTPEARLQRALDLGYRHLGKRDRTEAEVRGHLAARDVDQASIDGAIEALVRQGYVDDARYARTFAEDRRALDDWGPERIERRLLALGVDPELVSTALSVRDGAGELDAAVTLLRRRFGAIPDSDRERDRALRMLARKGYDLELSYDAVRALARASRTEPTDERAPASVVDARHHERMDADDLYGLPLDEFIPARGELAKQLRKAGQRDEAKAVAARRKPSVAAWGVNQLVRTQRPAIKQLFEAGDELRDAQSDLLAGRGDGRALRAAGERERAAVDDLVERARGLLSSAGNELSASVIERVSDTLHAAALDEDAREQVLDGRLERELRHVGLGFGLGAGTAPEPAPPARAKKAEDGAAAERAAKGSEAKGGRSRRGDAGEGSEETKGGGAARAGSAPAATEGDAAAGTRGAGADARTASTSKTGKPETAAAKKRAERERAAEQRAEAERARRERAAARRDARAAHASARRRADAATRVLAAAEEQRDEAARALAAADEALTSARDDARDAEAALKRAQAGLDDAERKP